MAGGRAELVAAGSLTRYRGGDRRRTAAPESPVWRTSAAGLFAGVLLVALLLRLPADRTAAAFQTEMLLLAAGVLASAAGGMLLLRHSTSGRTSDLFSGLSLVSLGLGHL